MSIASVIDHPVATFRPAPPELRVPLLPVVGADLEVPVLPGGTRRYVNLDLAASAPALVEVADTVAAALPWYSSVHRGAGFPSRVCSDLVDECRAVVHGFVGARPDDVVVFTRNTTDALNLLASAIPDDVEVITFDVEHHANLLPWRRGNVRHVDTPRLLADVPVVLDEALHRSRFERQLIAVTGASNVTGELLPLREIVAVARRHGARVAVDAAQLAPHLGVDIDRCGIDYLVLSGHKLYAPYGAGALIGRRDWLDEAPAYLAGGGAVRVVGLSDTSWQPSPARHEGGTPNVIGAVAIAAACRTLARVGLHRVARRDHALLARLATGIDAFDGVSSLAAFSDSGERIGILSLDLPIPADLVAAALSAEHGIGTRDGAFCAHPLMRRIAGVGEDVPVPNALRVSIGVGTTTDDVDRFLDALDEILRIGPRAQYHRVDGRLCPVSDARPRPRLLAG